MKKEALFEAIGDLDTAMIAETEKISEGKGRRMGLRVILVAAIMAGLALTAGAAPLIRNALKDGSIDSNPIAAFTPTNPVNGSSYEIRTHDIRVEIELDETAPEFIETYYLPQIPQGYVQYHGALYNQNSLLHCVWKAEDDYDHDITYWQTARWSYDPDEIVAVIDTAPGEKPVAEMRTYADIEGYYAEQKPVAELPGSRLFFWSDGSYLYRLELPYDYTDTQIEEMITSLSQVTDIAPYLISEQQ